MDSNCNIANIRNRCLQEKEQQRQVIEALKKQNLLRESDLEQKTDASETLKRDLAEKTEEYMQTLDVLKKKQVIAIPFK